MKRSPMRWWKLAPALLLAGMTWSGVAAADDGRGDGLEDEFDGPGGFSAPADPDRSDRSDRKSRMNRDHHGDRGGMHGMRGMRGGKGRHGRMGAGMRGHRQDVMARLDLSDRQKEQIQGIRQENQRRMIPINARLQEARLDLRQLMQADSPNQARIDAAIDRMADLRAEAHKARLATHLEIRSVLTEEQRKKLREQGHGRGDWMRDGGHGRPGKGKGQRLGGSSGGKGA